MRGFPISRYSRLGPLTSMRILTVTSMYPTKERPNYGIFVADQVGALRAAGIDVDVLCINPQEIRLNYGLMLLPLVRRLRAIRYDVVHTHHTYTLLLVDLARRLAHSSVPLVLTNHEGEVLDAERRTRTLHPTSLLRHSVWLKRIAAHRADFTIFVSRRIAAAIAPAIRHDIIPCGVDLELFKPLDKSKCRAELGLAQEAVVVFFPNNPHGMGKRFALVRAAHDVLRRNHPMAVLLTAGAIPHDRMPVYYNAADVVMQASYYEASPMVVKEALACEVPLVSTDVGDTRDVVEGLAYCFVCRDDPVDLANHAEKGLGHRTVGGRQRLCARGLGLDQVADRMIDVYRQIGNGKRAGYAHTWNS
jgi:teichuronic acid biosynthesis glycosyltransferase TuaC